MGISAQSFDRAKKLPGLLLAALMLALSACAALPGNDKPAPPRLFVLELPPSSAAGTGKPIAASAPVLLIASPTAAPGFNTPAMAYVKEKYRLDYFARHRWVDTPANMLKPLIAASLRQADSLGFALTENHAMGTDLRLETKVLRLQQVFSSNRSELQFDISVQLFDDNTRQLLATREFNLSRPDLDENPYAGVVAANELVAEFLQELKAFLLAFKG